MPASPEAMPKMEQITFRSGEFQPFIATRKFDLGATGAAIP